jgi:hypothetical protein
MPALGSTTAALCFAHLATVRLSWEARVRQAHATMRSSQRQRTSSSISTGALSRHAGGVDSTGDSNLADTRQIQLVEHRTAERAHLHCRRGYLTIPSSASLSQVLAHARGQTVVEERKTRVLHCRKLANAS